MASSNEREIFPVPLQGVRKDIDELVSGPEAAVDAENVLVYDDVLRPRPVVSKSGFGQQATTWVDVGQNVVIPADHHKVGFFTANGELLCVLEEDNDDPAPPSLVTQEIHHSNDGGATFAKDTAVTGLQGKRILKVVAVGTKVWFFTQVWKNPTVGGHPLVPMVDVYVSAIDNYPTTPLSFSSLGTIDIAEEETGFVLPAIDPDYDSIRRVTFDDNTGHLFLYYECYNAEWGRKIYSKIVQDAETATGLVEGTDIFEFFAQAAAGPYFNVWYAGGYGLVYTSGLEGDPPEFSESIYVVFKPISGTPMTFDSFSPIIDFSDGDDGQVKEIITSPLSASKAWFLNFRSLVEVTFAEDTPSAGFITGTNVPIFPYNATAEFDAGKVLGHSDTVVISGVRDTIVTQDDAVTWEPQPGFALEPDIGQWLDRITESYYFYTIDLYLPPRWVPSDAGCFIVPGTVYPSGFDVAEEIGDVTSIYQADMDTEEKVIIVGSTKKLTKLNRATTLWEEITSEYDVGPPIIPDTRLGGVHGDNPVVFRTFETGGRVWILATNGSDYPLIWNPDLPGGKARFMGQIVAGASDPRYNTGNTGAPDYSIDGDDAPKARCMAIAANRVVLANLPGMATGGVDVSDFNDPDRGYGKVQMAILGDTPGAIISANEISALQIAMYKEDAIYHAFAQVEFLGVAAPFRFELVKAGISGPCSPLCVLSLHTGAHAYLARDGGIYVYDGSAPKDVGRNVRRLIQPYLDENTYGKAWGMADTHRKLLWFFYPTKAGALNRGVVMATDQGYPWPVWPIKFPDGWQMAAGMRAFFFTDKMIGEMKEQMTGYGDQTLGSFVEGREEMIMGRLNNTWYTQQWDDSGASGNYTDDTHMLDILLKTGWNPLGSLLELKTVHELFHVFSPSDEGLELNVTLLARQLSQKIVENGPRTLMQTSRHARTSHRATGERFAVEIEGKIDRSFKWGGATALFRRRGGR